MFSVLLHRQASAVASNLLLPQVLELARQMETSSNEHIDGPLSSTGIDKSYNHFQGPFPALNR